jgi:hypothetical protein
LGSPTYQSESQLESATYERAADQRGSWVLSVHEIYQTHCRYGGGFFVLTTNELEQTRMEKTGTGLDANYAN